MTARFAITFLFVAGFFFLFAHTSSVKASSLGAAESISESIQVARKNINIPQRESLGGSIRYAKLIGDVVEQSNAQEGEQSAEVLGVSVSNSMDRSSLLGSIDYAKKINSRVLGESVKRVSYPGYDSGLVVYDRESISGSLVHARAQGGYRVN